MAVASLILVLAAGVLVVTCAASNIKTTPSATSSSQSNISLSSNQKCSKDIPKSCPVHEEVRCVNKCPPERTCKNRGIQFKCAAPVDPCENKCVCKKGYFRNSQGTCVTEDKCDIPTSCPANEEVRCMDNATPERTCKTRDLQYRCTVPVDPCKYKCVCKEGFYRNFLGTCITNKECDQCSGDYEFFACDSACDNECSKIPEQNRTNCPIQNIVCNRKCYCEDGFARDNDRNCVPVEECPDLCPMNEEYNSCTQAVCRNQNCTDKDGPVFCPRIDPAYCNRGCVCKENYYRNSNGTCVAYDECDAPPEPTCGDNEVLDKCPSDCPSDYCPTSEEDNEKCPQPDPCPPPACKCAFNYRRSDNGTCIPTVECPPFDCSDKPNEEWTPCPPICPSDACNINRVRGTCPWRTLIRIRLECNPRCQCKDGYGRLNEKCVPYELCPNLCPLNEEYSSCTQTLCRPQKCSNRFKPKPCPTVEPSSCKRDCVCKQDYFRNGNGTCVIEDDCVDKQCPNPNEKYAMSQQPSCPTLGTCMSIVERIACDKPESLGCICKSGFFRDDKTSVCIRLCKCPQMATSPDCEKKVSS